MAYFNSHTRQKQNDLIHEVTVSVRNAGAQRFTDRKLNVPSCFLKVSKVGVNLSLPRCNPHRLPSATGLCKAGKSRYVSYLCLPSLCVTLTLLARRGRKLYAMEGRTKSSLAAGVDWSTLNAHSIKCSQIFVLFLTKNAAFFILFFLKKRYC